MADRKRASDISPTNLMRGDTREGFEGGPDGPTVMTGQGIAMYRLLTLRMGLKAEVRGMRMSRGRTCYAVLKEELGLRGSKAKVLEQVDEYIAQIEAQG